MLEAERPQLYVPKVKSTLMIMASLFVLLIGSIRVVSFWSLQELTVLEPALAAGGNTSTTHPRDQIERH